MEEVDRHDILGTVDVVDGRIHAAKLTSVNGSENELMGAQYMNLHRLPENIQKVHLVTDTLGADLLNHQVVELATSNEFVSGAVGGQYYDEELLAHDLTEEDKRLAAALVAVQLVHQQKHQQFGPELLATKNIPQLSPLQSGGIEKPTVAAMVTSYFEAFDEEDSDPMIIHQHNPATPPELKLPPLKKVLTNHTVNRQRVNRSLFGPIESPEEQKTVNKPYSSKVRKSDIICDSVVHGSIQEFHEQESDVECETETKPSRRSLPHKKRIPRKLKSQHGSGSGTRLPAQHTISKGYKCPKCGDTFMSHSALSSHRVIHTVGAAGGMTATGGSDGGVAIVAAGAVSVQSLGCPIKRTAGTVSNGFSCEICGITSTNQIKFFQHLKSHYEPNIVQVEINDQNILEYSTNEDDPHSNVHESFSIKNCDSMQVLKLEPESDELSCNQCGRIFRRKKALESHLASAHPPAIEEFSEPEDMMEGIRHVVNIQTASPDDESEVKIRSWRLSDELKIEDDLLDTVKDDGKEDSMFGGKDSDEKNKKRKKAVQCPQCSRTFTHRNSLLYHVRSHSGRRPHQCDVCGKGFFAANALRVHMRMHSGDKPYKCEFCLRHFRQWGDLKYHITSLHSTTKQYQCEFCGKDFARKYSLIVHRRIHTGEKNYVCEFCRKTFRASSYLVNHRRIHTGEKPHNCDVCHKPFRVKSDMKRHRNTHNKDRGNNRIDSNNANNNSAHIKQTFAVAIENIENQVRLDTRATGETTVTTGDVMPVGESITGVESITLSAGSIPLNLNIRSDSSDTLTSTLDRDPSTLYVWLPPTADSILPD